MKGRQKSKLSTDFDDKNDDSHMDEIDDIECIYSVVVCFLKAGYTWVNNLCYAQNASGGVTRIAPIPTDVKKLGT